MPDFRLEDVWALPGVAAEGDFPRVVEMVAGFDPAQTSSPVVRTLFVVREKLGEVLGWDSPDAGVGSRVASLRDRMPPDLRAAPPGPQVAGAPFTSLYLLDDEWAAEIANRTVHGVLHLGRVPIGGGRFRVQLAIYVKPNGLLGRCYLAAIRPFRYLLVYPTLLREGERIWRDRAAG